MLISVALDQRGMKFHVRSGHRNRGLPANLPVVFLGAYALALLLYATLILFAVVPDSLGVVESLKNSPYGLELGGYSIGYLSILVMVVLAFISIWGRKGRIWISKSGAASMVILGLILGSSFAAVSTSVPPRNWLYNVQDSEQGFNLTVFYNSTTLTLGKNLTMRYTLTDDSYSLTTPYYLFGGQFSMVFYNSTGKQVVAFRAPIAFAREADQHTVKLEPGETWSTLLDWDGLIIPLNGSSYMASPGHYNLASYAALQDANASLYVVLHPSNITVSVVTG
ncbi:MAG: hypothetical protein KGI38_09730 [Thaumarchaeota archaeon]|nr:hypothetical protein [Nitrososphaerota archaeon]